VALKSERTGQTKELDGSCTPGHPHAATIGLPPPFRKSRGGENKVFVDLTSLEAELRTGKPF